MVRTESFRLLIGDMAPRSRIRLILWLISPKSLQVCTVWNSLKHSETSIHFIEELKTISMAFMGCGSDK